VNAEALRRVLVIAASARKGFCFIATAALGETKETRALRAFRDLYLRQTRLGRRVIATYYRVSPGLCRCLESHPILLSAIRTLLKGLARMSDAAVEHRLNRRP
jgi:hypothetical protein